MSRGRSKGRMKVIPGGKQMCLIRDTDEVIKFLQFAARETLMDSVCVEKRISACQSFFKHILEEEDHVDYILSNLDTLLTRELSSEDSLTTLSNEQKKEAIQISLENYRAWSSDPFGWERGIRSEKPCISPSSPTKTKKEKRVLQLPIREDFLVEVSLPAEGLSVEEFQRLGMFLYPYCKDIPIHPSSSWPGK